MRQHIVFIPLSLSFKTIHYQKTEMGGHRVYIGRLARDATRRDLEDLFKEYGRILDITVKAGFGFVEFENKVDAEDAVHDIHDTKFLGQT